MDAPTADIEFLARSEHRPRVLEALAERPCDRYDLPEPERRAGESDC